MADVPQQPQPQQPQQQMPAGGGPGQQIIVTFTQQTIQPAQIQIGNRDEVRPLARNEEDVKKFAKAGIPFIIPHSADPDGKLKNLAEQKTGKPLHEITFDQAGPNHGITRESLQRQDDQVARINNTRNSLNFAPRGMKLLRSSVSTARKLVPGMRKHPANAPNRPEPANPRNKGGLKPPAPGGPGM